MKKILILFFVILLSGCAAARRTPIPLPHISSPAAEKAGVSFYGTPFQVINSTSFYCRVVIGNKDGGVLHPGDVVWDNRRWHNQFYQYFAVAAICYRDAALTNYIGSGGRILALSDYNVAEWTIRMSDIRTPDGRTFSPVPNALVTSTSRRIKLPREWWASSVGIQVINNTTEDIKIFINGRPVVGVGTGGVDYVRAELVGGNIPRQLIITITNGRGCTHTEQVWVQKNYPWVRQIVFGPEYCGWR